MRRLLTRTNLLSLVTCLVTLWSLALIGDRNVLGLWLGAGNQVLWFALGVRTKAYGLSAMAFLYAFVYGRNIVEWSR